MAAHASSELAPQAWHPPARLRPEWVEGRVTLRPFRPTDATGLFEAVDASRETLAPWVPWALTQHRSVADSASSIDLLLSYSCAERGPDWAAVLGIFESSTGALIGGTGFNRIDTASHNAETGYWVRTDRRGQGWCTQAVRACLTWGFLPQEGGGFGWRRVHLFASALNAPSIAVPTRLGLRQHHHATLDRWIEGRGWSDTLGWEVLRTEWEQRGEPVPR